MEHGNQIHVEVAYALPHRQVLLSVEVPYGSTAIEAVQLSEIGKHFPELDLATLDLGVFSQPVSHEQVLEPGDRVEIYRPLLGDPKEIRRRLAAEGRTMGDRTKQRAQE